MIRLMLDDEKQDEQIEVEQKGTSLMTSDELSNQVALVVAEAQARITGIGAEQYASDEGQKFERMALPDLLVYFEEELLDQINYSVMNIIRLRSMRGELDRRMDEMRFLVDDPENDRGESNALLATLVSDYRRHG